MNMESMNNMNEELEEDVVEEMYTSRCDRVGRSRATRRKNNYRVIRNRMKIVKTAYGFDWYEHSNQYSKGKIHCSCALCAFSGISHSDMKKYSHMDNSFSEYEKGELEIISA